MKIFMSYRREDSPAVAGRIAERLRQQLGPDNVFKDVDSLGPGEDFLTRIQAALTAADVLIAVIGPNWLNASNRPGRRRLDDADDWVRIEIREALRRDDVRVVPLLVEGAAMPAENDLPPGLKALAHRSAYPVRSDPNLDVDLENLVARLKQGLSSSAPAAAVEALAKKTGPGKSQFARLLIGTAAAVLVAGIALYLYIAFTHGPPDPGPLTPQGPVVIVPNPPGPKEDKEKEIDGRKQWVGDDPRVIFVKQNDGTWKSSYDGGSTWQDWTVTGTTSEELGLEAHHSAGKIYGVLTATNHQYWTDSTPRTTYLGRFR